MFRIKKEWSFLLFHSCYYLYYYIKVYFWSLQRPVLVYVYKVFNKRVYLTRIIVNATDDQGRCALLLPCNNNEEKVVDVLKQHQVNPSPATNEKDAGDAPLINCWLKYHIIQINLRLLILRDSYYLEYYQEVTLYQTFPETNFSLF